MKRKYFIIWMYLYLLAIFIPAFSLARDISHVDKELIVKFDDSLIIFPKDSGMIGKNAISLSAIGNPSRRD